MPTLRPFVWVLLVLGLVIYFSGFGPRPIAMLLLLVGAIFVVIELVRGKGKPRY